MPYATDAEVPSHVPKGKRSQWREVWNSAYAAAKKDGKSDKEAEASAFAQANGVTGAEKDKAMRFEKFIPFAKVDAQRQEVWGIVTAEVPDKDQEVCDYESTKPFYQAVIDEMSKATNGQNFFPLRYMHQLDAVGKCVGFDFRDTDREVFMGFKVVDAAAWKKVDERVLTGFSHGGKMERLWDDPIYKGCKRYTANPSEISLVDNPCLAEAHFAYIKADGTMELRKFKKVVTPTPGNEGRIVELEKQLVLVKARLGLGEPTGKHFGKVRELVRKRARIAVNRLARKAKGNNPGYALAVLDSEMGKLAKNMSDVSHLAQVVNEVAFLAAMATDEAKYEGDNSELPAELAKHVDQLLETLLAMVEEEGGELKAALRERASA